MIEKAFSRHTVTLLHRPCAKIGGRPGRGLSNVYEQPIGDQVVFGRSDGVGLPRKNAPSDLQRKSYTERPC
jgi:hypothetical protein